jgi:pilus assembly protein CpaE
VPFQYDFHVILDMPDVWTDIKRELLRQVDRLVVVAEPTLVGVHHIENTRQTLDRMNFNLDRVLLVINQAQQPGREDVPASEITTATGFEVAAVLPYDAQLLGRAEAAGTMALDVSEHRALSRGFVALARILYDRDAAPAPGLMARLRRYLRKWW